MIATISHPIAYLLAGGCFSCVLLIIWQIIQPDVWYEKILADEVSSRKAHRRFCIATQTVGVITILILVVLEVLKRK